MLFCDAHNDFLTEIKSNEGRIKYIKEINRNKSIKKVCAVIWTSKFKNPIRFIKNLEKNVFSKVDIKKIVVCIEDLGFINKYNFRLCLEFLIKLKPFSCGLTWNMDNSLGGGAFGNRSLSRLGKDVIKELEKNNILIDTAHMNRKTFNCFAKITSRPIYNSHSNIYYLHKHCRNLNNLQIKKICNSGGLFCLSFVRKFISKSKIISFDVAHQVDFFVKNFCIDNLAIGTDFFGTHDLPINLKNYNNINDLKEDLIKLGFKKQDIFKIFYKNFLTFYNSNK